MQEEQNITMTLEDEIQIITKKNRSSSLSSSSSSEKEEEKEKEMEGFSSTTGSTRNNRTNDTSPDDAIIHTSDNVHHDDDNDDDDNNNDNNDDNQMLSPSSRRKTKRGGQKRKLEDKSKKDPIEDRHQTWRQERYDKLLYNARKDITKVSKQVRAFECQKCIRRIQQEKQPHDEKTKELLDNHDTTIDNTPPPTTTTSKVQKWEQQLLAWKSLPLENVVHQAIRQLGLFHLNPSLNVQQQHKETIPTTPPPSKDMEALIQEAINHKKLRTCLEGWNEKVTDYRRWCLRLSEKYRPDPFVSESSHQPSQRSKKTKGSTRRLTKDNITTIGNTHVSAFVSLGVGDDDNNGHDEQAHPLSSYGPAAAEWETMNGNDHIKRNRKGQRQRKAKAMALRAQKEGRKEYESLNWRSKRDKNSKKDTTGMDNPTRSFSATVTMEKKDSSSSKREDASSALEHPSWVAKKQQSQLNGKIVPFQGTKITF